MDSHHFNIKRYLNILNVISYARGTKCKTPCVLGYNTKVPWADAQGSYSA